MPIQQINKLSSTYSILFIIILCSAIISQSYNLTVPVSYLIYFSIASLIVYFTNAYLRGEIIFTQRYKMWQYFIRLIIVCFVFGSKTNTFYLYFINIMWELKNLLKIWFNKGNNQFPQGVSLVIDVVIGYFQLLLFNNYIKVNVQTIQYSTINLIRVIQLIIILSGIRHLISSSKTFALSFVKSSPLKKKQGQMSQEQSKKK